MLRYFFAYRDSGAKTCCAAFYMYMMLYLCISAPLYEASCSNDSEKNISAYAIVAKSAIHGCLQLSRHPCRLWLCDKQSPKNNKASSKSRDMHKYNIIYIKVVKACFDTGIVIGNFVPITQKSSCCEYEVTPQS